jgi:hypothetical protein
MSRFYRAAVPAPKRYCRVQKVLSRVIKKTCP